MFTIIWAILVAAFASLSGYYAFKISRRSRRQAAIDAEKIRELEEKLKIEQGVYEGLRETAASDRRALMRTCEQDKKKAVDQALLRSWPAWKAIVAMHRGSPLIRSHEVRFQLRIENRSPHMYRIPQARFSASIGDMILDGDWKAVSPVHYSKESPAVLRPGDHINLPVSLPFTAEPTFKPGDHVRVGFYARFTAIREGEEHGDEVRMVNAGDGDLTQICLVSSL